MRGLILDLPIPALIALAWLVALFLGLLAWVGACELHWRRQTAAVRCAARTTSDSRRRANADASRSLRAGQWL